MPGIFLSYARETETAVKTLADDIDRLGYATWLDHDLNGGRAWWEQILTQIRDCEIFVMALSTDSLRSTACTRECGYAEKLGKPILPIMVADGVSANLLPPRLSQIHIVDYRKQDRDAIAALARALRAMPSAAALPQPLPEPPAAPISYLSRLAEQIDSDAALDAKDQAEIVSELRSGLGEADTAADARALLERLRKRPELLARIGKEIDTLLENPAAEIKAERQGPVETARPSVPETPSERTALGDPAPAIGRHASSSLRVSCWLVGTVFIVMWVFISPIAIHGALPAPNAMFVVPIATLLLSLTWPIRPLHAVLFAIFAQAANLVVSLLSGVVWEKQQETGAVIFAVVIVLNTVLVAWISRTRLRGAKQVR